MTDYSQTQLEVENPLRSSVKVRRLTPKQLGIPSSEDEGQSEEQKWELLEEAALAVMENREVGAAVRTEAGEIATGVHLDEGCSRNIHALELAVWTAYAESETAVAEVVFASSLEDITPCGRCLQIVEDYSLESLPEIRILGEEGEIVTQIELEGVSDKL